MKSVDIKHTFALLPGGRVTDKYLHDCHCYPEIDTSTKVLVTTFYNLNPWAFSSKTTTINLIYIKTKTFPTDYKCYVYVIICSVEITSALPIIKVN